MKKHVFAILFFLQSIVTDAQNTSNIRLYNPAHNNRDNELVMLSREQVLQRLGKSTNYVRLECEGKVVPVQYVDNNGDERWDELAVLLSFKARQTVQLNVVAAAFQRQESKDVVAHVRMRKKAPDNTFGPQLLREEMPFQHPATDFTIQPLPLYLTEGPAWENNKVGFRLYFDVRNGKDIWGKTTEAMVLDSVGLNPANNYHQKAAWGMDVLKVGKSLGAGSSALAWPKAAGGDSIIRIGGTLVQKTTYQQLADGPLLGRIQLQYTCKYANKTFQITEVISIWGGQYFYESRVSAIGLPAGVRLVSGLPDLYPNVTRLLQHERTVALFSHGRQSENHDALGLALLVGRKSFDNWKTVKESSYAVTDTHMLTQYFEGGRALFRFYAGWEGSDARFADLLFLNEFLKKEAERMSHPIIIQ